MALRDGRAGGQRAGLAHERRARPERRGGAEHSGGGGRVEAAAAPRLQMGERLRVLREVHEARESGVDRRERVRADAHAARHQLRVHVRLESDRQLRLDVVVPVVQQALQSHFIQ